MTANEAHRLGMTAPKGARCPLEGELAVEWTKGRDQARRIARLDLRPSWRRKGEQKRYVPSPCR
jgi:hypothetical protein